MSSAVTTPGARGPYRNGIRRREQIVQSASQVFAEFGYAGASIRSIAERVGVSPASLLQHFGSKEGLLTAVLEDWDHRISGTRLSASGQGLDFFRAFPHLMRDHLVNRGLLELFLTMAAEASSPIHPARNFIQRRYADNIMEWAQHLVEAAAAGDIVPMSRSEAEDEVRLFIAVLDGTELQWLINPSTDLVGLVTAYLDQAIARWQALPTPEQPT